MKPIKLSEFTTLDHSTAKQYTGIMSYGSRMHAADLLWTEKYLSTTPFYSLFWAVRRIRGAIREHAKYAHGRLLDIGCGVKPYRSYFQPYVTEHMGIDYAPSSGYRGNRADICGDAGVLPFADGSFDTVLASELMVDLPDPDQAISEFSRVLGPGGTLITTAAFAWPVHDRQDFYRFSPRGLATIMERHGLEVERVVPMSGTAITLVLMFNLYWHDTFFIWNKWLYPIGVVLRPMLWLLCLIINLIGGLFEVILPDQLLSFNHLTVAHKPGRKDEPSKGSSV
jgi:SAM-dependent methyltransferase